jgi:hypothetical protein
MGNRFHHDLRRAAREPLITRFGRRPLQRHASTEGGKFRCCGWRPLNALDGRSLIVALEEATQVSVAKGPAGLKQAFRGQTDVTGLFRITFDETTCGEKSL